MAIGIDRGLEVVHIEIVETVTRMVTDVCTPVRHDPGIYVVLLKYLAQGLVSTQLGETPPGALRQATAAERDDVDARVIAYGSAESVTRRVTVSTISM